MANKYGKYTHVFVSQPQVRRRERFYSLVIRGAAVYLYIYLKFTHVRSVVTEFFFCSTHRETKFSTAFCLFEPETFVVREIDTTVSNCRPKGLRPIVVNLSRVTDTEHAQTSYCDSTSAMFVR